MTLFETIFPHLEGEEGEEGLIISISIQFSSVGHTLDDLLGAPLEDLGAVDSLVICLCNLLPLPEVIEGRRVVGQGLVVPVVGEVVLGAKVEPKEGVKTPPCGCVLCGTVAWNIKTSNRDAIVTAIVGGQTFFWVEARQLHS